MLVAASLGIAASVLMPIAYLLVRALDAEPAALATVIFRARNLWLLGNTLGLTAGVLIASTAIALPLAWLSTRTDLPMPRLATLVGILPLAVPPYLMAYAYLALGGDHGAMAQATGIVVPRLSGYAGALTVLTICFYPYLYLNMRAALLGLDPALEEAARSLGRRPLTVFRKIILPQLRPAGAAGGLLVVLHVLSDFGGVSLMRFETFSYALYLQYIAAFDRTYAAWLALFLLGLTLAILAFEAWYLRGLLLHRTGSGTARHQTKLALGVWRWPALAFVAGIGMVGVVLPLFAVLFWLLQGRGGGFPSRLFMAMWDSVSVGAPAALAATALALPVAYLGVRYPSPLARALERTAYMGYATPALAFALGFIFFSLHAAPTLYQTRLLLIAALALHFMAEAIGPLRSALFQARPSLEESARMLGRSPLHAFYDATFPLLRRGVLTSIAFVFLASLKELPMTFLLAPIGFQTLSVSVWGAIDAAMFAEAAPFALTILVFSGVFAVLLQWQESP